MTEYSIITATHEHGRAMAPLMRAPDAAEVEAMTGRTPAESLFVSIESTPDPRVAFADDDILCIFGVAEYETTILTTTGVPWMLGTDALPKHAMAFLKGSKEYIAEMADKYPLMVNFVDARNELAIRWLRWLNFTIKDPIIQGKAMIPFHPFFMRASLKDGYYV